MPIHTFSWFAVSYLVSWFDLFACLAIFDIYKSIIVSYCLFCKLSKSCILQAGCIVSASVDGTVKVWSHRGIEITTLHGNGQRVNACAVYVPENKRKGEELSTSWAEMVQDATDYEEKSKEFDLEGVLVASGGEDGTVRFWKALQVCPSVGSVCLSVYQRNDHLIYDWFC